MSKSQPHLAKPHLAWVPNALTMGRIIFIPVLIGAILTFGTPKAFLGAITLFALFIVLILTDFLDGFFARRWHVTSNFGRMIDPIADKLFVAGLLITFAIITQGAWWILAPSLIIIGRDIFISGLREHVALEGIVMAPTQLAKWKTATEMAAITALLIWLLTSQTLEIAHIIGITLLWIAAALSAYTGLHYARSGLGQNAN